jgi:hypothetical protein
VERTRVGGQINAAVQQGLFLVVALDAAARCLTPVASAGSGSMVLRSCSELIGSTACGGAGRQRAGSWAAMRSWSPATD